MQMYYITLRFLSEHNLVGDRWDGVNEVSVNILRRDICGLRLLCL